MTDRDDGFLLPHKASNGHLPCFLARITSREIVPAGRIFPLFFPRMGGPELRSPLLSCPFLIEGKD